MARTRTLFLSQERTGSTFLSCLLLGVVGHFAAGAGCISDIYTPVWLNTRPPNQCLHYHGMKSCHMIEDWIRKRPSPPTDESYMWTPPAQVSPTWYDSFPPANWRFVYLFRDPRNRIESLASRASDKTTHDTIVKTYTIAAAMEMESIYSMLDDPRFLPIRFEHFIRKPLDKVSAIFEFMGYKIIRSDYEKLIQSYTQNWINSSFGDNGLRSNNRWACWTHEQRKYFNLVAGSWLRRFGYEASDSWIEAE